MAQETLKITLEYDGSAYHGWQIQPGVPTVQAELENAFSVLMKTPIPVTGQGRTDSGVHALAQTAHVVLPVVWPDLDDLQRRLNGILGRSCAVTGLARVADGFHARYDARERRYRYQIVRVPSPLRRATHWHVHGPLDLNVIEMACEACLGEHDFTAFCTHSRDMDHARCTITAFTLDKTGDELTFRIAANRFLHNMVRRLVGEMIRLARGRYPLEFFTDRLENPVSAEKGLTAPPHGLFLEAVIYPE